MHPGRPCSGRRGRHGGLPDRSPRGDPATGEPIGQPLTGHTSLVNSVAFGQLNDRTVLATGSRDETVRLWDPATGEPIGRPLTGHTGTVTSVAFGQVNGHTLLASVSASHTRFDEVILEIASLDTPAT